MGRVGIIYSYFARHTERLLIRDEDLGRLWDEDKIAIHYPDDKSGRLATDSRSTNPEDYEGPAKTAIRRLHELGEKGGYVWMESRVESGRAKVGYVEPDSGIELDEDAQWEVGSTEALHRKDDDKAILKTIKLTRVRHVERGQQMGLRAGRPQQGTIVRWHKCGSRLVDLVEDRPPSVEWDNLSTEQQEAACAEFLRFQQRGETLPRLNYLLLPVGRTLEDVDIYGLAEDGREIFAQVTHHSLDSKAVSEKEENLKKYGSDGAYLIFFGVGKGQTEVDGITFVRTGEVMDWMGDIPEYCAALFPEK